MRKSGLKESFSKDIPRKRRKMRGLVASISRTEKLVLLGLDLLETLLKNRRNHETETVGLRRRPIVSLW